MFWPGSSRLKYLFGNARSQINQQGVFNQIYGMCLSHVYAEAQRSPGQIAASIVARSWQNLGLSSKTMKRLLKPP